MPRYFFHVDNGKFVPDATGTELPGLHAARVEAVRASGEMINDVSSEFWEEMSPWNMHVTDDAKRLLFTLQFYAKVPSGEVLFVPRIA